MLFPTVEFALFFLLVFYFSWELYIFPRERKIFLLLASYFFYATMDLQFLPILIASPLVNFLFGRWILRTKEDRKRKHIVTLGVTANLLLLGTFKYFDFFVENIVNLLGLFHVEISHPPFMNLVLPLGISFFTFQGISYVVDTYKGELDGKHSLLDVLLFISFFPHLVAGPIVKAADIIPQFQKRADPKSIPGYFAFALISFGLIKKVVIANYLGTYLVDPVFESPKDFSGLENLFAVYGYAVQIYCDFSAYSDMAIGLAALLGFEFPMNFNQPYRAESLQDFWRRWHISLSTWLRNYLFISLGGNREGRWKTYRNLFLTMLLGGLWHGASWNFIAWGVLHGTGLIGERVVREKVPVLGLKIPQFLKIILTFHFVCLAWIFFRASTFESAWEVITSIAHGGLELKKANAVLMSLLAWGMCIQYMPSVLRNKYEFIEKRPILASALALTLAITLVSLLAPSGVAPFIYFRF